MYPLFLAVLCACAPSPGYAEEIGFFHTIGDNGEISFTQSLDWDADPYALGYEICVRDGAGIEIFREFTEQSHVDFRLTPGEYEYNIVTKNLLDQAEAESGWQRLIVIKAEIPSLEDVSPSFIFMDSLDGRVTLSGKNLMEGAEIFLVDKTGRKDRAIELARADTSEITVTFDDKAFRSGTFGMLIVNPGGIEDSIDDAVRILFQRPVDILVSAGYAPMAFFADDWFMENWPEPFQKLGAIATMDVFFIKKYWGFLGAGISGSGIYLNGGTDTATLTSTYFLYGASLLYKYRFSRTLHGVARVGGGLALSDHEFTYGDVTGISESSTDPFAGIGISAQYYFKGKFFLEGGADWVAIMGNGHTVQGIRPCLKFGYQVF